MNRRVLAVVDDLFFKAKIRAVAEAAGVEISFPRTKESLLEKARETRPDLIVVDLHSEKINPIDLAKEWKTDEKLGATPMLGFFSHVETELKRAALAAGYDEVVPRSVFARDLAEILNPSTDDTDSA